VNGQSAVKVERIRQPEVIRPRPALSEASDDGEAAVRSWERRSRGDVNCASDSTIFDNQQHLTGQIDRQCTPQPYPGVWYPSASKRAARLRADDTIAIDLFPALKCDNGMPGHVAEDAVDSAAVQVAELDEPPLQQDDRAPTVAVAQVAYQRRIGPRPPLERCDRTTTLAGAQLGRRRGAGQHKQCDERPH
jgi:hypothetical protein